MEYICFKYFAGKSACNEDITVHRGEKCQLINNLIVNFEGRGICYPTSQIAKECFARNDDGRGLERGDLTYAIAYSKRVKFGKNGRRQRFTDEEIQTITIKWKKFLIPYFDVILFNDDFFNAEVDELREMAASINIKVKR